MESWLDQEPFEQRLLDNLDAFAALGGAALPTVALYCAEAESVDPERSFAAALTLGCIAGSDTIGAAVIALKQSSPETLPGWMEGLALAPNPSIEAAMADLCAAQRPELVALALDVLHARGETPPHLVASLLGHAEPAVVLRVARALATALPSRDAIHHLEHLCAATDDDDIFLAAVESLLRRGHGPAIQLLRSVVDGPASSSRATTVMPLLCVAGRASDLDRLLRVATAAPTARAMRGLGRFGHVESLGVLIDALTHEDREVVAAAAESIDRITAAGLREMVEEPWEIELPPEAAGAGGIPVPKRKVERVVTDPKGWSAWLRDNARRFNVKLKTRGGRPFTPLQIMDELEARTAPPGTREEAALELALVTGLRVRFSPHDWVARQRRHLFELRTSVAAIKVSPGAWSHGLEREPERAASPLPSGRIRSASDTPASLSNTARTERAETDVFGAQQDDAARAIDTFAVDKSLPFHPAGPRVEERRDPRVSEQTSTSTTAVDLGKTMAPPLLQAPPALPFHTTDPARSGTAGNIKPSPSASVGRTVSSPLIPAVPVLPFRPAKSPAEQDISNMAPASGHPLDASTSLTMTRSVPIMPTGPVTPFRPPADSSEPTPLLSPPPAGPEHSFGVPRSSASPPPSRQLNPPGTEAVLSLAQYASLCAELAVFPWATEAIFQRYGLDTGEKRHAVDAAWKERLRRDRGQYESWQQMYRNYHDYWTKRGTPVR
ncbi:hypothetical protein BE04_47285 [Sorangium cellulosum]|uniref:Uncharacterized protein n=1 Tax=Sorangium cellulosum TaxID=56 RepID=A0A150NYH7_SORCE|nr:hypothetical protein BE04_47285 [Sorangium cellulosum]